MPQINFFAEDIRFVLRNKRQYRNWIDGVVKNHGSEIGSLNYIFCSDDYLLNINREYLNHDTFTDIVTFDNSSEEQRLIESDVFISIDRVKANAKTYAHVFSSELSRVMIHGVLHLLGFSDKTNQEKERMRKEEEACLSLLPDVIVPRGTLTSN